MTRDATDLLRTALPRLRAVWPIHALGLLGTDATAPSRLAALVEFDCTVHVSVVLALEVRLSKISRLPVDVLPTAALKPDIRAMLGARALQLWPPRRNQRKSLFFVNKKKQKNFIRFR